MLLIRNILLIFLGLFIYILTVLMPLFKLVYFDYIALIVLMLPVILDAWDMKREGTFEQTDRQKKWTTIVDFIDRDRDVHTVVADRPYHALSFLQAKGLGLVENKGKDSVLKKGTKKYVLALENCEHTPDPDMMLASEILYELGIQNSYTLKKLLTGKFLDAGDYKLMGQVLINMQNYELNHGGHRLVKEWKEYDGKNMSFKPKPTMENPGLPPLESIQHHVDTLKQRMNSVTHKKNGDV